MRDNYFKLDDYFRKETLDASTLNVFDEISDEPVLHVRYLNPRGILVTGRFSQNGRTVIVSNTEITTDAPQANHFMSGCGAPLVGAFEFQ